ncbi:MAG: PEP-CTERM/exosortase system-associated acyltransferase [Rhodospirillales bacterium]
MFSDGTLLSAQTTDNDENETVAEPQSIRFVLLNDTPLLDQYFRLRWQVYCNEKGFLSPDLFPGAMERDEFDEIAYHFGCVDEQGTVIAGVRLVPESTLGFPAHGHCRMDIGFEPWASVAELSRLVFSKGYRRGSGGAARAVADCEIVLGLYRAVYRMSKRTGITHWLAAMEPSLARLLNRFHFSFAPVGPVADYYGAVQPYLAGIDQLERSVFVKCPDLYWDFTADLEETLQPRPWLPGRRSNGWYALAQEAQRACA